MIFNGYVWYLFALRQTFPKPTVRYHGKEEIKVLRQPADVQPAQRLPSCRYEFDANVEPNAVERVMKAIHHIFTAEGL